MASNQYPQLPTLPLPDIPTLANRNLATARVFLSDEEYSELASAMESIFPKDGNYAEDSPYALLVAPLLEDLKESAASNQHGSWANVWFEKLLLSTRFPIANTIRISLVMDVPGARAGLEGRLLRAIALWGLQGVWGDREVGGLLAWQGKGYWGTFREPETQGMDVIKVVEGRPRHVVVWHKGIAWEVIVIGDDGKVLSEAAIQQQIDAIKSSEMKEGFKLAAYAWRNDRPAWYRGRKELQEVSENAAGFEKVYSSLFSVALEDYAAPEKLEDLLDDIRIGKTSENRFPDQTLTAVIYSNGKTGLTFDHTPGDFQICLFIAEAILSYAESEEAVSTSRAPTPKDLRFHSPSPSLEIASSYTEPLPRQVRTFSVPLTSELSAPIISHRLADPLLVLAFQEALLHHSTLARVDPIFQPVWLRNFRGGRCDPMCPVTEESLAFLERMFREKADDKEELFKILDAYLKRRKQLILERADGKAMNYFLQGFVHPALIFASDSSSIIPEKYLPAVRTVASACSRIAGTAGMDVKDPSSVQFTGFTFAGRPGAKSIKAGLSNIYLPDQLVVFYLWRDDEVVVTLSATGRYRGEELEKVLKGYEDAVKRLIEFGGEFVRWREERGGIAMVDEAR